MRYMTSDEQWCGDVADMLQQEYVGELSAGRVGIVLAVAERDRDRAWKFIRSILRIGFCPFSIAEAVIKADGYLPPQRGGAA